jgi:geranylgeranyl pyrophosphate synthase
MTPEAFKDWLASIQRRMHAAIDQAIPIDNPYPVAQAMRYSALAPGKRLRPALVFAAGHALAIPEDTLLDFACALEMIHCYSLIHDDLPAMDNDDLRRGRPTCHKAFDEATAILAGDGLLTLAFTHLAQSQALDDTQKVKAIALLGQSAGHQGMILGQSMDMTHEHQSCDLKTLERLHRLKTGALIECALRFPTTLVPASAQSAVLIEVGQIAGLLFQIQDDILDVTSDTQTLGKPQGSDANNHKTTYVSLLGLERAQSLRDAQRDKTHTLLNTLGSSGACLRALMAFLVERTH